MSESHETILTLKRHEDLERAAKMMLYGDTTRYFSLIEPSDKEWLMKRRLCGLCLSRQYPPHGAAFA